MNFKQLCKTYKLHIFTLIVITLLSCFYISGKEGYHMDELLSFELSNAEFTPWIVPTQPQGRLEKYVRNEIYGDTMMETLKNTVDTVKDVLQNKRGSKLLSYTADVYEEPVWISRDEFVAYETTDKMDDFNYLSVYFNVKDDNHPPLHFMALHTVSSIFRGKMNVWMGCLINLAAILGTCILLMRICTEVFHRPHVGIYASLLYACSMAGVATLLLIRMYAMLAFFCVCETYLHLKKLQEKDGFVSGNKLLILVTVLGFWTQYFFVFHMLFLALITLIYLVKEIRNQNTILNHHSEEKTDDNPLKNSDGIQAEKTYALKAEKSYARIWGYIKCMMIAGFIGIITYPFAIKHVLYSGRGVESVSNLKSGFSGMGERLMHFGQIVYRQVLGGVSGSVIVGILLIMIAIRLVQRWGNKRNESACDLQVALWVVLVPCIGYFLITTKVAPFYEDRYLMPAFPGLALLIALLIDYTAKLYSKENVRIYYAKGAALVLLLLAPFFLMGEPNYQYKGYESQVNISEEYKELPCICVYDGVGYYQNLVEFMNYKETLLVTQDELLNRSKDLVFADESRLIVLLKNRMDVDKISSYLENEYGFTQREILLGQGVHGDRIILFAK